MRADFPLPDVDWEPTAPFWEGASRRQLLIPRCDACSSYAWYPRGECRQCEGESFTWRAMSGRGRLFAWTVVRHPFLPQFADRLPYLPALVALEEDPGVRLVTAMVDCRPEELAFDMAVRVVWREMSFPSSPRAVTAPYFTPDEPR